MSDSGKAVFLSYASQDADAAKRICEALRQAGVEVWFDQSELRGGDAWDAMIRRRIKECALFVPVISASTQARAEGYFRLEWKLAVDRSHLMSDDAPFLFPIALGDVSEATARVPDRFRDVQWTRLRLDETPAELAARVARLLSGGSLEPERPRSGGRGGASARRDKRGFEKWWWLIFPIMGMSVPIIGLLKKSDPPEHRPAKEVVESQSEARRLAAQAKALIENGDDANRETYATAEELLKRAVALDAADGEVLAIYAQLSTSFMRFGLDTSTARRELARTQAERAVLLAPDSDEAQFALSYYYYRFNAPEAEKRLRRDLAKRPDDRRLRYTLALALRQMGRRDEAMETWRQITEMPGSDAASLAEMARHYVAEGRVAEAEAAVDRSLALRPSGRVLWQKIHIRLQHHGDLEAAQATVQELPAWAYQEDRGAYLISQLAMWRRDPESALRTIQRVPREYLSDNTFTGPKAVLLGEAHELAGRADAARNEWRTALQLIERMLAQESQAPLLYWRAWLQAALGDRTAAEESRRLFAQTSLAGWTASKTVLLARIDLKLGRTTEVLESLTAYVRGRNYTPNPDHVTPAALRLDPTWDPLRSDPRFGALLQAAIEARRAIAANPDAMPASPVADKSVAVLAFANLSDDKANEYFSDGISEELLNVLAKVPGLKVSARTSAFYFKGKNVPIPEIARQLGVAYVVEGSVRKQGDKVRITAQLIKAADGFHIWSDTFTRDLQDIFAVQDEIAGLVARELQLKLSPPPRIAPIDPEAMELYLRARQAWGTRTDAGLAAAEDALNRAIALAPGFARAHAALVDVWMVREQTSLSRFGDRHHPAFARMEAALDRALQLEPGLAEAYAARGSLRWNQWRFAEAEEDLEKAVALNPNYATAHHWLGRLYQSLGRVEDALAAMERAARLDPLSSRVADNRAFLLVRTRSMEEALAEVDRALYLQPENVQARRFRAVILAEMGRAAEAGAMARELVALGDREADFAAYALARSGAREEAERQLAAKRENHSAILRAGAEAALGRYDACLEALRPDGVSVLNADFIYFFPVFDPLRVDPRFRTILGQLGLVEAHARAQAWRAANPPAEKRAHE